MKNFKYGEKEINYLSQRDEKLGQKIKEIGIIKREVNHDIYKSIVRSIIGQQISTTVQKVLTSRLKKQVGVITPKTINLISDEALRELGLSSRKIKYIKMFTTKVISGELDLNNLKTLSDQEVIKALTTIKGIGIWTAEMTLLFSLERPNVFSFGDLAIKRGLMVLHNYPEITKEIFEKHRKLYSPYCSVASLYLWELSKK